MARSEKKYSFEEARQRLVGILPPEDFHRESQARLEARLLKRFKEAEERRKKIDPLMAALREPLVDLVKQREGYERNVSAVRELARQLAKEKLEPPKVEPVTPRIFTGSVNLTTPPPYTWPWTWSATSGSALSPNVSADNTAGTMGFFIEGGNNGGGGSASAMAAMVTYVQPMTEIGILLISSAPAFNYKWWSYNTLDSSHSSAWIGLFVIAYTLDFSEYAVPIEQQIYLWDESHSFFDSSDGQGSNSGFPLSATTIVNGDSFYQVWVVCGGTATADGYHTFWGSSAASILTVAVPAINMELY